MMAQYDSLEQQLYLALQRYHALMANIHGVLQHPIGSAAWNAWMAERMKAQVQAQHALQAYDAAALLVASTPGDATNAPALGQGATDGTG
jgi:hypothetical protein